MEPRLESTVLALTVESPSLQDRVSQDLTRYLVNAN